MTDDFYRIRRLPPYVFAEVNAMKAATRARGEDIVDLGMGNPDGALFVVLTLFGAPAALAALVAGLAGFSLRGAAIARGLSLPAYDR